MDQEQKTLVKLVNLLSCKQTEVAKEIGISNVHLNYWLKQVKRNGQTPVQLSENNLWKVRQFVLRRIGMIEELSSSIVEK